jgi:hypothetical protein
VEHIVAGRIFPTADAAGAWLSEADELAGRLDGRHDLLAFLRPALLVPELDLVLQAFPVDPVLPGLALATDPVALVERLGPLLTSAVPGLLLQDCRVEVVRYRPGSCVLRYELAWRLQPSRRSLKQVLYGKVYEGGEGRLVGPVVTALRNLADGPGPSLPFLVPRFRAYLPDLRVALLDAVPGSPLLPALIRADAAAPAAAGPTPEEAVATCARIAAALHRSAVPGGVTRTLAEEIDAVRAAVDDLAPMAPVVAASLHRHLGAVGDLAVDEAGPIGLAHGDFDTSQVLFDGPTSSLVDFDTVCRAEPALDLGQFTAHLAVAARKGRERPGATTPDHGEALASAFLGEYVRLSGNTDPAALLVRVAAYRTLALVRSAARSWCRLKPERLRSTLAVLDERPRIRNRVP